MDNSKDSLVIDAVKKGVSEGIGLIEEIDAGFRNCSNSLRIEQTEDVFNLLSHAIDNIKSLLDFIKELENGIQHISSRGYELSTELIPYLNKSTGKFDEMLSAFESKDWITVADIMEYEISPLLQEIKKLFEELNNNLKSI